MSDIEQRLAGLSPAKQALLRARMQCREQESRQGRTIPRQANRDELPLSFAQERIWLHEQLVPEALSTTGPRTFACAVPFR